MFYIKQELPINEQIKAKEVQLISDNGEKLGVLSFNEALNIAEEKKLDCNNSSLHLPASFHL